MDADQRLSAAHKDALDGRHAEALAGFIWFHHYALDSIPSLYGVRRSFAMGYWLELGESYPPALLAMKQECDKVAEALLRGEGDLEAFRDVISFNEHLDTVVLTHQLYVKLLASWPEMAKPWGLAALPATVEARDFLLAAELLGDPAQRIVRITKRFNDNLRSLQGRAYTRAPIRWSYTNICTNDIRLVLTILEGCERHDEARQIRAQALKLIQSPSARRRVDEIMQHPHKGEHRITKRELRSVRRLHGLKN